MEFFLKELQTALGYSFKNSALLLKAITHRSFSADHNERLEFLGDSVLNLAVSSLLFDKLVNMPEGDLSRVRANLVKQETLHQLALNLRLPQIVRLGEGEAKSGGRSRPSILADAVEALIGAVYWDADYLTAQAVVHRLFEPLDIQPTMSAASKDAKTALQEWLQGRKLQLPAYAVNGITGAAHAQCFQVECSIEELNLKSLGKGSSRRSAEQDAAATMLVLLKGKK